MSNRRQLLPLCAAVAAMTIGASQPASAVPITDSSAFSANETISLNLFNPSTGTLTGVALTIDSSWATSLEVDYDGPEGSGGTSEGYTANGQSSHSLTVANLFGGSGTLALGNLNASCSYPRTFIGPEEEVSCFESSPDSDSGDVDGDIGLLFGVTPAYNLSNFVGIGTFSFDLSALASELSCYNIYASADADCNLSTTWSGTVTVAYTYREPNTAVPLPGTLALLSIGLAGLGWRRRKPR